MEQIAVSVIVPIYNVEAYLKECLDSLEGQTLKNIEVIMVNDGSTDNSRNIAEEYAHRNDNFILIDRSNGGLSAARNTGMSHALGKYIYFLDSDDYILDSALETLYTKAEHDKLDVLKFGACTFSDVDRELKWSTEDGYKYKGNYPDVYSGIDILQRFIDNSDDYPSCCLIFTRLELIRKCNLNFLEGVIHEDHLFQWELMSVSQRVTVLNRPLYCRRFRPNSITTSVPDWKKKAFSMSLSMIEADRFVGKNPWIKSTTTDWYLMCFAVLFMNCWMSMSEADQNDKMVNEWYERIAPLAKKYGYRNSIRIWIFFTNRRLFMICRKCKRLFNTMLGANGQHE